MIPSQFPAVPQDMMEYLLRGVADQQLHLVMTFAERLDVDRLARAVRLTLDMEPVLGCRFIYGPEGPYWVRHEELDALPYCQITEGHSLDTPCWQFITTPVDPARDLKVQAHLFRAERDTLCLKLDHVAADAGGVKQYARLLASTYRTLANDPGYHPLPNVHGRRGMEQIFAQVSASAAAAPDALPVMGFPLNDEYSAPRFGVRRIAPERFHALKDYGRQSGATVNDVLLAAFYRGLFAALNPPYDLPLPVQVALDLRRYLPDGQAEAVCNLAGSLHPSIIRKPGAPFDVTFADVRAAMRRIKEGVPGIAGAMALQRTAEDGYVRLRDQVRDLIAYSQNARRSFPLLSNLGVIDDAMVDYGSAQATDAYMVSPVANAPHSLLGVSTFHGTMTLTMGYTGCRPPVVDAFLNTVVNELPRLGVQFHADIVAMQGVSER